MATNNVVQHPALVGAKDVRLALRGLYAAGVIKTGAYSLGSYICVRMEDGGGRALRAAGREATNVVLQRNGVIYSGPLRDSLQDYIQALQELQFRAGIRNSIDDDVGAFTQDELKYHFTISPMLRNFSMDTLVTFVLPDMTAEAYHEATKEYAEEFVSHCQVLQVRG